MKKALDYFILVLIYLGVNFFSGLLVFLFGPSMDAIGTIYAVISLPFIIIISIVLTKFIEKKSLSIYISVIVLFVLIFLIRFFEVYKNHGISSIFIWSNNAAFEVLIHRFNKTKIDSYEWTLILYPMMQPIILLIVYKIIMKYRRKFFRV